MEAIKERVSSYWTKRSADFAKLREKELESELAGLWLSEIEAQLPKETGLRILDVGTGSGFFAVLLAEKGHHVTGIDLTPAMIEEAGGVCLGIACVVDRTRADAPSPIPIVASAAKLDLPNYLPEECPICAEGKLPLVHLGSRKMKEQAKQTL